MNTPLELTEWLTEKIQATVWAGVKESRTVEHVWRHHSGGRVKSAALSASISPSSRFSIAVLGSGEPEYCSGARNGAISVLLSQSWSPVLRCHLELTLMPHDGHSSYAAFFAVAKEATEQLLGVRGNFPNNISWGTDDV